MYVVEVVVVVVAVAVAEGLFRVRGFFKK